jgi:hypothetical protein
MLPALAAAILLAVTAGAAPKAKAADTSQPPAAADESAAAQASQASQASTDAAASMQPEGQASSAPLALSPMHQEIRALLDQQRAEVEALSAQIAQQTDATEVLELQRAVEASKRQAQVGVLEVQLRHARAAGKAETVTALQSALRELLSPPVKAQPQARPARPQDNNR